MKMKKNKKKTSTNGLSVADDVAVPHTALVTYCATACVVWMEGEDGSVDGKCG